VGLGEGGHPRLGGAEQLGGLLLGDLVHHDVVVAVGLPADQLGQGGAARLVQVVHHLHRVGQVALFLAHRVLGLEGPVVQREELGVGGDAAQQQIFAGLVALAGEGVQVGLGDLLRLGVAAALGESGSREQTHQRQQGHSHGDFLSDIGAAVAHRRRPSMTRLTLLFALSFALGFGLSSCGGGQCSPKNCLGCCDVAGLCHGGDQATFCGTRGLACMVCDTTQACQANACVVTAVDAGCAPTPIACPDQAVADLTLFHGVSPAAITNTPDGGEFLSDVVATGGGLTPTQSYVYARFTDLGLEKVAVDDYQSQTSMDWDIAFRRFVIRLNGGDSGPSCVGAQLLGRNIFDQVSTAPSGGSYAPDNYFDAGCTFIDDQSGLPTPSTALNRVVTTESYYSYTSAMACVAMTGQVAVVQLRSGRTVKLAVTKYYQSPAAQLSCNTTGNSNMNPGGYVQLRWAFLP
jgi:hypothetical protein